MSVSIVSPERGRPAPRQILSILLLLAAFFALGAAIAQFPPLAFLAVALAGVAVATRCVKLLSVALFWTLPYMVINLPTGSFTLKLCDGVVYLFAAAWALRAALRREKIVFPPATVPVLIYLAVLALSTAFEPPVPLPYVGSFKPTDRNSPLLRSGSLVIWLSVSWLVVTALYNVIGQSRDLFRRCVCAHVLSGGFVSVISLITYATNLIGLRLALLQGHLGLFQIGDTVRLAGPAYEPMFFGFYLVTTLPVTLIVCLRRPRWLPRGVVYVAVAAQSIALLLTFSTGGWAGLLAALLVLLPLLFRSLPLRFWLALGAVVAVIAVVAVSVPKSRIGEILWGQVHKGVTGGTRAAEFQVGYSATGDYPVLGLGPGMATFYFGRYHPTDRVQKVQGDQEINNAYINVAAESGFVGLAAFLWCGLAGVSALLSAIRRHGMAGAPVLTALTASLVGCAVQYTALNPLFLVFFPVLIGLATAGARVQSLGGAPETVSAPSLLVGKAF